MRTYHQQATQDGLEPWPFDENSPSQYRIVRGSPKSSGRLDVGTLGGAHRMGIWACTAGTFECIERGDELQTILEGRLANRARGWHHTRVRAGGQLLLAQGRARGVGCARRHEEGLLYPRSRRCGLAADRRSAVRGVGCGWNVLSISGVLGHRSRPATSRPTGRLVSFHEFQRPPVGDPPRVG